MSEEGSVSQCLEMLGLQEFAPQLMDQGFDRLHDILSLDEDDFAMLIRDEEVQTRYKTALQQGNDMQVALTLFCVGEFRKLFETITVEWYTFKE